MYLYDFYCRQQNICMSVRLSVCPYVSEIDNKQIMILRIKDKGKGTGL